MGNAVATVLLLIVFIAYAVFFALWNPLVVPVTGFSWAGVNYGQSVPLFMLPLAGLLIGAIVMAIAMAGPWGSMKCKLDAERAAVKERTERIEALRRRIEDLKSAAHKPEQARQSVEPASLPATPEDNE